MHGMLYPWLVRSIYGQQRRAQSHLTANSIKKRGMGRNHLSLAGRARLAALLALALVTPPLASADTLTPPDPLLAIGWLGFDMSVPSTSASCSAVLIAPDLVATAAHCVVDGKTGAPRPVARMTFAAGRTGDSAAALRHGAEVILPEPRHLLGGALPYDAALLRLDAPIPASEVTPLPLAPAPPAAGDILSLRGYARETPATPTDRSDCIVRLAGPDDIDELLAALRPQRLLGNGERVGAFGQGQLHVRELAGTQLAAGIDEGGAQHHRARVVPRP